MSFWDEVSNALGTDGSNNGLLPSISNALGTDGSKNGLLNDPYSMAALALAGGAYLGYIPLGGSASVGGTVAPTEGAAAAASGYAAGGAAVADAGLSIAASDAAFGSALASSGTAASTAAWSLPAWLTPSNTLTALTTASKFMGGGAAARTSANPVYAMPNYYGGPARTNATKAPGQASAAAPDGSPLLLIAAAAAAFLLLK